MSPLIALRVSTASAPREGTTIRITGPETPGCAATAPASGVDPISRSTVGGTWASAATAKGKQKTPHFQNRPQVPSISVACRPRTV